MENGNFSLHLDIDIQKWFWPLKLTSAERDALPIFLEPCVLLLTITVILSKKSKKVMI